MSTERNDATELGQAAEPAAAESAQAPANTVDPYLAQRVTVGNVGAFRNDHSLFPDGPGFHIYGECPHCRHETSSVCAAEQLGQTTVANNLAARAAELQRSAWSDPWDGAIKEKRRLHPQPALEREPPPQTRVRKIAAWSQRRLDQQNAPTQEANTRAATMTMITVMRCACTQNHPAASAAAAPPAGSFGCGAEWLLRVEYSRTATPARLLPVGEQEAALCWPAADAAAAELPNALTTAQTLAKNWGAGLTAVLTILGIGALLTDTSDVRGLQTGWQVAFGLAALIAVLADIAMLYATTLASSGAFTGSDGPYASDARNADLDPLLQARASQHQLRQAMTYTTIAIIAALLAATILIYGSQKPTPNASTTSSSTAHAHVTDIGSERSRRAAV